MGPKALRRPWFILVLLVLVGLLAIHVLKDVCRFTSPDERHPPGYAPTSEGSLRVHGKAKPQDSSSSFEYCSYSQHFGKEEWNVVERLMPCLKEGAPECVPAGEGSYCAPNFIIVGQAKCATSSLNDWISRHPQYVPHANGREELGWLSILNNELQPTTSKYLEYFPNLWAKGRFPALIGEKTPVYSFYPQAADFLRGINPKMKVILVVREPLSRIQSLYLYRHSETAETGRNMYRRAASTDELLLKEMAILKKCFEQTQKGEEGEPVEASWLFNCTKSHAKDLHDIEPFDWLLANSIYVDQIRLLYMYFDPKNVLILDYHKLLNEQEAVLYNVTRFLQIIPLPPKLMQFSEKTAASGTDQRHIFTISTSTRLAFDDFFDFHKQRLKRIRRWNDYSHLQA